MAKIVIKSNGTEIPFDSNKIVRGISRSALDAKLSQAEIDNLVDDVTSAVFPLIEQRDVINSSEIRDMILSELDRIAPKVATKWRRFMEAKKN